MVAGMVVALSRKWSTEDDYAGRSPGAHLRWGEKNRALIVVVAGGVGKCVNL